MSGGGGKSVIDEWIAHEEAEEEARKPKFKRNEQGYMRQVGLKYEFDCPECSANNPWDQGFNEGDEVTCHYCGQDLKVVAFETKRVKWKLL